MLRRPRRRAHHRHPACRRRPPHRQTATQTGMTLSRRRRHQRAHPPRRHRRRRHPWRAHPPPPPGAQIWAALVRVTHAGSAGRVRRTARWRVARHCCFHPHHQARRRRRRPQTWRAPAAVPCAPARRAVPAPAVQTPRRRHPAGAPARLPPRRRGAAGMRHAQAAARHRRPYPDWHRQPTLRRACGGGGGPTPRLWRTSAQCGSGTGVAWRQTPTASHSLTGCRLAQRAAQWSAPLSAPAAHVGCAQTPLAPPHSRRRPGWHPLRRARAVPLAVPQQQSGTAPPPPCPRPSACRTRRQWRHRMRGLAGGAWPLQWRPMPPPLPPPHARCLRYRHQIHRRRRRHRRCPRQPPWVTSCVAQGRRASAAAHGRRRRCLPPVWRYLRLAGRSATRLRCCCRLLPGRRHQLPARR